MNEAPHGLRVMSIGLDPTIALADPSAGSRGDSRRRQEEYASLVASYTAIVKTPASPLYRSSRWESHAIFPTMSRSRWTFPLDAYALAASLCREQGADVVVTQDPFVTGLAGYAVKRRFGVPLCIQLHSDNIGSEWWLRESIAHRPLELLGRWLVRRADTLQVVSNTIANRLIEAGVDRGRIWNVMPAGGVDVESFRGANGSALRARLLEGRYRHLALFVGRMVKVKDLPTLLLAARTVLAREPETLFVLVGEGEECAATQRLASEMGLGDNVVLPGGVGAEEVPAFYAACDLFVMSSLYEGKARSLVEAACAGKPIVTTAVSGADEVVLDGETGFLVPVRDHEAMADRILRLLQDREKAAAMGQKGQELAARMYDRERNLDKIAQMWEATAKCRITAAKTGR